MTNEQRQEWDELVSEIKEQTRRAKEALDAVKNSETWLNRLAAKLREGDR